MRTHVAWVGAQRDVLAGDRRAVVRLAELRRFVHLYALGPLEGLRGPSAGGILTVKLLPHIVLPASPGDRRSARQKLQSDPFGSEWQLGDPHAGGIVDRVGHGGRRRHDRRLANPAGTERPGR